MTSSPTIMPVPPPTSTPSSSAPSPNPPMAVLLPQPLPMRRVRPSQVQTSLPAAANCSMPASAVSISSTSGSQQPSPTLSPQATQVTTSNSSIQGSPDGLRGRDFDVAPLPYDLPESIVSRKSSQSAMSEAMALSKPQGIIRRISNRASKLTGRRRPSSTTANSRDHSSGPVVMRRRSDSNSTAPEVRSSLATESEDEREEAGDESNMLPGGYDAAKESSTGSPSGSGAATASIGPVIPALLLAGIPVLKISKKKKKTLTLVLDMEGAKVSWDKTRPNKSFYVDDIREIRSRADARNYRQEFGLPVEDEARFFSIHYAVPDRAKSQTKAMHVIAPDEQTLELWTSTLDAISKHRHELMASLSSLNDKAVRTYWRLEMHKQFADRPHAEDEEEIDLAGVQQLCRSLHIYGSYNYLRARFEQADATCTGHLNFAEFQEFVRLMKRREDIRALYRELASNVEKGITLEEFLAFLRDVQCEDVQGNQSHWESVFAKFVRRSKTKEQAQQDILDGEIPMMSQAALASFLTSTFNVHVTKPPAEFSLDRPMNEYFISSSHNTYLLGRQVAGQSSVEAYISALSRGCRCVEVDCWNGPSGPVVMHGRTLTTQVTFADVMSTIGKYAFVKTPYPLWVSLEVHCNREQQAMMAQIIKDTCGSKLVTEPLDRNTSELPSPSRLLNRILIKVKAPRRDDEPDTPNGSKQPTSSPYSPYVRAATLDNAAIPSSNLLQSPPMSPYIRAAKTLPVSHMRLAIAGESQDSLSSSTSESESVNDDGQSASDGNQKKSQSNIIKVLGELGVYSAGIKFHSFDSPESKIYNHVYSFMEQTFSKHSRTAANKRALVRHNMRYMMRVYPNGWRVASTNFDPLTYWRRGVQMAALNWQTHDLSMQLNDAMFAGGTDQSGYVLKPSSLREIKMLPNVPEAAGAGYLKRERQKINFSIDVISAQQLMRPKNLPSTRTVDPYIQVEVYHSDDKAKDKKGVIGEGGLDTSGRDRSSGLGVPHRRRTQIVPDNGFNPIFDKKFNFELITKYPELVFVRFTVRASRDGHNYDEKSPPLAVYMVKLSSLQQGYRTIPLMDNNGDQFLFSTIFCRIKKDPVTSIFIDSYDSAENLGKLKSISRSVFRSTPITPKTSGESSH